MISRVSVPDFGANSMPIPTPTPSPSKKLESPFLSMYPPAYATFNQRRKLSLSPFSSILRGGNRAMHERKPRPLSADALWSYALKLLSGRAYSIGELREKLRRRAERI